jgi:hypothetical protein
MGAETRRFLMALAAATCLTPVLRGIDRGVDRLSHAELQLGAAVVPPIIAMNLPSLTWMLFVASYLVAVRWASAPNGAARGWRRVGGWGLIALVYFGVATLLEPVFIASPFDSVFARLPLMGALPSVHPLALWIGHAGGLMTACAIRAVTCDTSSRLPVGFLRRSLNSFAALTVAAAIVAFCGWGLCVSANRACTDAFDSRLCASALLTEHHRWHWGEFSLWSDYILIWRNTVILAVHIACLRRVFKDPSRESPG